MKEEIAYRFAATAVKGVSLDDAHKIIDTFKTALATCSLCNNSGRPHDGLSACKACQTRVGELPVGNHEAFDWNCLHNKSSYSCREIIRGEQESTDDHTDCHAVVKLSVSQKQLRGGV